LIIIEKRGRSNKYDRIFRGKWDCSNPIMDHCFIATGPDLVQMYHENKLEGELKTHVKDRVLRRYSGYCCPLPESYYAAR